MADVWGGSWGTSWGTSWAEAGAPPAPTTDYNLSKDRISGLGTGYLGKEELSED